MLEAGDGTRRRRAAVRRSGGCVGPGGAAVDRLGRCPARGDPGRPVSPTTGLLSPASLRVGVYLPAAVGVGPWRGLRRSVIMEGYRRPADRGAAGARHGEVDDLH